MKKDTEDLYKLWILFAMTKDAIFWATKEELSRYGMNPIRSAVLFFINSLSVKATPSRISKILLRKRHSVNELLTRMEKSKLVKRLKVSSERNLNRYELTGKGRELYRQTAQLKTVEHVFSSLNEEQRQQLSSLLHILLVKAMEEMRLDSSIPLEALSE